MRGWLRAYGWKFALALIVAVLAMAYLVHLERVASGEAAVRAPAGTFPGQPLTRAELARLRALA